MCKDQGRSNPEVQGKKDEATDGYGVEGRGFKKIKGLE